MSKKNQREELLDKMFLLIRENPGIRHKELHSRLGLEHSAGLRNTLIKRGLVRKERKGVAVHYFTVKIRVSEKESN